MAFTPEQLAVLEAQRAYFASDERLRERAEVWRDKTPEECLEAVIAACRGAARVLSWKTPDELERALVPVPLPPDTVAILEALQKR